MKKLTSDNQIMEKPDCEKCKEHPAFVMIGQHFVCGNCAQAFTEKMSKAVTGALFD